MPNCSTCKHNSYIDLKDCRWFDCVHPVTIAKRVKWEQGDPKFVEFLGSDFPISMLHNLDDCPTWEAVDA